MEARLDEEPGSGAAQSVSFANEPRGLVKVPNSSVKTQFLPSQDCSGGKEDSIKQDKWKD